MWDGPEETWPPRPKHVFETVITETSSPAPHRFPSIPTYVQLPLCLDMSGHNFKVSYPAHGQWGEPAVVCARCGLRR